MSTDQDQPQPTTQPLTIQLLLLLTEHPEGLSLSAMQDRFPGITLETLRSAGARLATKQFVHRLRPGTFVITPLGRQALEGEVAMFIKRAPTKFEREGWESPKWVHPIRARALGLRAPAIPG